MTRAELCKYALRAATLLPLRPMSIDAAFIAARGTPRQGVLRAALDAQRKKRADALDHVTSRATHKHT